MSGTDGTPIENALATAAPTNYEICQRTGFRVERGSLAREWDGKLVRQRSYEPRQPLDLLRTRSERPYRGLANPEPQDQFISAEITPDDL